MIVMRSAKTDEAIKLPILPEAEEILLKYDYQLPFISDQKYNKAIKDFLKELDFDRKLKANILLHFTKYVPPISLERPSSPTLSM